MGQDRAETIVRRAGLRVMFRLGYLPEYRDDGWLYIHDADGKVVLQVGPMRNGVDCREELHEEARICFEGNVWKEPVDGKQRDVEQH